MLLSIDIGFRSAGWSLWDKGRLVSHGLISTEPGRRKRKSEDNVDRVAQISCSLKDLIEKHRVRALVAELPNGGAKSARALSQMAMATATVAALAAVKNLPVEWVTALEGKKAACGKKDASKDEVCASVRKLHPKARFPAAKARFEHIADSCAAYMAARGSNVVRMFG